MERFIIELICHVGKWYHHCSQYKCVPDVESRSPNVTQFKCFHYAIIVGVAAAKSWNANSLKLKMSSVDIWNTYGNMHGPTHIIIPYTDRNKLEIHLESFFLIPKISCIMYSNGHTRILAHAHFISHSNKRSIARANTFKSNHSICEHLTASHLHGVALFAQVFDRHVGSA